MTLPTPFTPGFRLTDGDQLNDRLANPVWSVSETFAATAGGTVVTSAKVVNTITNVTAASAPNAGIVIPQALPGQILLVTNTTGNAITVFADGGSFLGTVPGSVGVIQDAITTALYFSTGVDYWDRTVFDPSGLSVTKYQFISAILLMTPPGDPDLLYQAVSAQWDNATTIQFNTSPYVAVNSPVYNLCQTTYGYSSGQMATLMTLAGSLPQWG